MKRKVVVFVFFIFIFFGLFSGKFVEIWAKILRTPKYLPAPSPVLRLAGHIHMHFSGVFFCNIWFLLIVRVNVVSCRVTL